MADKKEEKKKAPAKKLGKGRWSMYKAEGNKLIRTHKSCPKCGAGTFLAQHKNRLMCGMCHYMESIKA
ncbi:30S ribosomal protein S27ae [Candidatus Woesearchaeota archaeon]|nr:30S ribosomal protein S27ae [Candidatus Woesearchaeota archaeon]